MLASLNSVVRTYRFWGTCASLKLAWHPFVVASGMVASLCRGAAYDYPEPRKCALGGRAKLARTIPALR